jgi:hypothetical protein
VFAYGELGECIIHVGSAGYDNLAVAMRKVIYVTEVCNIFLSYVKLECQLHFFPVQHGRDTELVFSSV